MWKQNQGHDHKWSVVNSKCAWGWALLCINDQIHSPGTSDISTHVSIHTDWHKAFIKVSSEWIREFNLKWHAVISTQFLAYLTNVLAQRKGQLQTYKAQNRLSVLTHSLPKIWLYTVNHAVH